ncbi:8-oxo-dGTP diphosphatase [Corynebacterium coyleae]|mgnify:CR=1 FL=1|uniref:8-oxo-dGTP diphosphatase n=1 Tax=Corynebacterium coyleae TaxID=53374 RepID=A0ABX8KUL8_9CORY|nr:MULTISPECIES: (deoxy)nucleoside triphosphate pyrophosphohydrolase [Corynebacterium]OHO33342.1 DNA mismatch repair protein MutT [Corynebacterium sp. HMSC034E11]QXB18162.1 (deoxy)nucleoside triphosphate pyrophosphohydrolase [Corynebacterium coyleae]WJY79634.1 CTP pyrophosphohydrolase [Corynebacterium coyleae]SEB87164.1 8-oxo-dGTP diphosphatase [Corynebacterium coyleae]
MVKTIEVVGAVIAQDGRIFAAKRGKGKSMAGFWEFPGGKIEPGESPQAALARELKEELRIEAEVGEFVVTTRHDTGDVVVELSTYICELVSGTPILTEHEEVRWVAANKLSDLTWAPADIPTVELLAERFG